MILSFVYQILLVWMVGSLESECMNKLKEYEQQYIEPIIISLSKSGYNITKGWLSFSINPNSINKSVPIIYGNYIFPLSKMIPNKLQSNSRLFRPSDAILFVGCSPDSIYFSSQNYLYDRYQTGSSKKLLFASLAPPINNIVVNISSTLNGVMSIIHTADKKTFQDIQIIFNKSILNDTVNLNSIPSDYFNFIPYNYNQTNISHYLHNNTLDTITPLFRIVKPINSNDLKEYLMFNQSVYLLSLLNVSGLENNVKPRESYDAQIRNTTSRYNEFELYNDSFHEFMNDLVEYFQNKFDMELESKYKLESIYVSPINYGFDCIDNEIYCGGDNRDIQYYWSKDADSFNLSNNSFYILSGINHFLTNQTIYSSVSFLNSYLQGIYIDNFDYNDSYSVLPIKTKLNENITSKFYFIQISRNKNCIELVPGFCWDSSGLGYNLTFNPVTRNYLNPNTMTRPDRFMIIPDVLLKFNIKENSTNDNSSKAWIIVLSICIVLILAFILFLFWCKRSKKVDKVPVEYAPLVTQHHK